MEVTRTYEGVLWWYEVVLGHRGARGSTHRLGELLQVPEHGPEVIRWVLERRSQCEPHLAVLDYHWGEGVAHPGVPFATVLCGGGAQV